MAHFSGKLRGQQKEVSRLGSKKSGLKAALNGWVLGVEIVLNYNESEKRDEAFVYEVINGNKKLVMTLVEPE